MPQLLLEILSEEIPARMQAKAEADLVKALREGLAASGLRPEAIKGFSGPRRLVTVVDGLPVRSADLVEDVLGPKEGAPQAAIDGFLRKAGLSSLSEAHVHDVPKKGRVYIAHLRKPGRPASDIIAGLVPDIIRAFHWPKSMRWGNGDLRWVRPISSILCTFDGEIVPFEIDGIASGNMTEGHRIMGRGPYRVRRFDDYEATLRNKGRVILDREERKEIILTDARQLCAAQNLELVEDNGLLEEVAGLVEYPVVIIGDMDASFLDLPPEVIRLSMRTHQKYFTVRYPAAQSGRLAPKFIVVANLEAADGGAKIASGNARVLSARLNDARFFWDNDRRTKLEERFDKLGNIVFHERLGTVKDKAERVMTLASDLALIIGADPQEAHRAAKLAKCDLVSDMVGEFAELEGLMGRYYALLQGEAQAIADAVGDHYKPKGPGDETPSQPVSLAVALADKIDTLVGFWVIDEKPTGSKDPFALRRAALGVVRMVLERQIRLSLLDIASAQHVRLRSGDAGAVQWKNVAGRNVSAVATDLLSFFADRLKVHLREQGVRHDLIDAVFALGGDDLVLIVKRVDALGELLKSEDGPNLLAGYRRAANILAIEEKKDARSYSGRGRAMAGDPPEVKALIAALDTASGAAGMLAAEDFTGAMRILSRLRGPVDAFFDKVTVNADAPEVRENRLMLLSQIRDALNQVADFSKIEG